MSPIDAAERAIVRVEPAFRPLVRAHGPCPLGPRRGPRSDFEALARAIAYQQLTGKAASTIWGRVRALVPGAFTPSAVAALPDGALRGAGLSTSKAASLRDLAVRSLDGTVPLGRLAGLPDHEIVERLTVVRGIGRWTAEMFLMFSLGRLDVWPAGDYGVRKGLAVVTGLAEVPTEKVMPDLGAAYAPFRSVAAWYCWRAVDTVVPGSSNSAKPPAKKPKAKKSAAK